MNERYKQIAERARYETSLYGGKPGDKDFDERFQKIFAELIVKECLKFNKEQLAVIPKDQKDWDGHNYGFTAAVHGFADLVKEYFGVEE